MHLAGPKLGGLRHDYRRPKHPSGDKFMLAAGHCAPTCYALWMIMGEALYRKFKATGDKKYYVAPKDGFLAIDASASGAARRDQSLLQTRGLPTRALSPRQEGPRHPCLRAHRINRSEQRRHGGHSVGLVRPRQSASGLGSRARNHPSDRVRRQSHSVPATSRN